MPTPAAAGFNGTYHGVYTVAAGTGTAARDIGTKVTATLKVRTTCTAGSCSTTVAINGTPPSPLSAGNGSWTTTYEDDDTCRDANTGKATGGSYHFRVTTAYHSKTRSGSRITSLIGTEKLTQLTKCPGQTNAILTRLLTFTLTRTGS